jgi:hypothetical protein
MGLDRRDPGGTVSFAGLDPWRPTVLKVGAAGSQVEMSKTTEFWTDPILVPIGSCRPEWLPRPVASGESSAP